MAKRNHKQRVAWFFYPSNPYNHIDTIFSEIGNQLVTLGIQRVSRDISQRLG